MESVTLTSLDLRLCGSVLHLADMTLARVSPSVRQPWKSVSQELQFSLWFAERRGWRLHVSERVAQPLPVRLDYDPPQGGQTTTRDWYVSTRVSFPKIITDMNNRQTEKGTFPVTVEESLSSLNPEPTDRPGAIGTLRTLALIRYVAPLNASCV